MARGENTANHPNRMVSLENFAQVARLGRELSKGFPQMSDDAPAGGIPRPKMHGCLDCGTPTPSDNGDTCVDCTNDRDEASAESWARNQRADAVKGMFGYPR
jgi:hypothetical protein